MLIGIFDFYICSDDEYVIFCHADSQLLVQRYEFNQSNRFTIVHSLKISNSLGMESPRMDSCINTGTLIVFNSSGTILHYKWTMQIKQQQSEYVYVPCPIDHRFVDEMIRSDDLSLEQQKRFEKENNRKAQVQQRKAEVLEIIAKLKHEFTAIKDRNSQLPSNYQLDAASFEIDKRITEDLEQKTQQKFKAIQIELQKRIDKIRTQAERMEHLYLDNLKHWPITLTGFRYVDNKSMNS